MLKPKHNTVPLLGGFLGRKLPHHLLGVFCKVLEYEWLDLGVSDSIHVVCVFSSQPAELMELLLLNNLIA